MTTWQRGRARWRVNNKWNHIKCSVSYWDHKASIDGVAGSMQMIQLILLLAAKQQQTIWWFSVLKVSIEQHDHLFSQYHITLHGWQFVLHRTNFHKLAFDSKNHKIWKFPLYGKCIQYRSYVWYYLINSYTEFHFLQVLLRLLIPCMSCISTSAMS